MTEVKTLTTRVYESIGAASMCWNPRPSHQIFSSEEVKEIGDELMKDIESDIPNAIRVLQKALREDKDYFRGWRDNISIQFQDEAHRFDKIGINTGDVRNIANKAAENFLNLLIQS